MKDVIKDVFEAKGEVMKELKEISEELKNEVDEGERLDLDLMELSTETSEFWKMIQDEVDSFTETILLSFTQYVDVILT